MAKTAKIDLAGKDLFAATHAFFESVLRLDEIHSILIPQQLPVQKTIMPVLISDPDRLAGVDPFSPAFMMNAAKLVSKLTRKPAGVKTAVVLRACEIRAFVELVKLKQARTDELIIIGIDCLGAMNNRDFMRFADGDMAAASSLFYENMRAGNGTGKDGFELAAACKACTSPIPENADILIPIYGIDHADHLLVQSQTATGDEIIDGLNLAEAEVPPTRAAAVESLIAERKAFRDKMFTDTAERIGSLEKLSAYLAGCVNCYNCRVACPVCYCKECVFVTDVFNHDPAQYQAWATRKGALKMPTDTLFYHITRLTHMSTACVGCGQCSNACPNDIDVMELFRTVAHRTQAAFDYAAGRDMAEAPPLSEFREEEFEDVVGIG